jgi:hypothetical protein
VAWDVPPSAIGEAVALNTVAIGEAVALNTVAIGEAVALNTVASTYGPIIDFSADASHIIASSS